MFYGEYLHSIDRKGRLILPAKFREAAKSHFIERFFVTRGLDSCLFMFSEEEWRAQEAKLKSQLEVLEGGTTDATAMQVTRGGLPVGCVSIPTRYLHTPSEMVDMRDVQASVQLLLEFLQKPIDL